MLCGHTMAISDSLCWLNALFVSWLLLAQIKSNSGTWLSFPLLTDQPLPIVHRHQGLITSFMWSGLMCGDGDGDKLLLLKPLFTTKGCPDATGDWKEVLLMRHLSSKRPLLLQEKLCFRTETFPSSGFHPLSNHLSGPTRTRWTSWRCRFAGFPGQSFSTNHGSAVHAPPETMAQVLQMPGPILPITVAAERKGLTATATPVSA